MKKILIIYPNWLPSNAVGVQRVRLIVNYLQEFGWEPILIAVNSKYYEEQKSDDLLKTLRINMQVEYVEAKKANPFFRLYGDITLRAFGNLKKKALEVIATNKIDFIWIPIPPFYTALLGRQLHDRTGIPYGIDYIDPWVHEFPGSNKLFSRAKLSSMLARILEPYAVKKASVITGVSEPYFLPVLKRNPQLKNIVYKGMPYGFDPNDYNILPANQQLVWHDKDDIIPIIYAGAFLPNAHFFIDTIFKVIAERRKNGSWNSKVKFYFIGTGASQLASINDFAIKYALTDIVIEKQERISYLEVLNNLSNAAGVLAIGSTEAHYTASKIFQAILSKKPVFAIFHHLSTVIEILKETNADNYLVKYDATDTTDLENLIADNLLAFVNDTKGWSPDYNALDKYSARYSAKALGEALDTVTKK